jgi:beta-lactamase superfamily II metal-dependent hydrolase
LLGGDLTFRGWKRLRERGCDLRTEVLVVPHHGSATGTAPGFGPTELALATTARYGFFSVGTSNTYHHPASEMVGAFRAAGSIVQCTQITSKCNSNPTGLPGKAVLPGDAAEPELKNYLRTLPPWASYS